MCCRRGVASAFSLVVHQARRADGTRGVSELIRVDRFDRRADDWRVATLWRAGAAERHRPALPPVAVGRVGDRVLAVPGGGSASVGAVPVAVEDPATLVPPVRPGLPSPSVVERVAGRPVLPLADLLSPESLEREPIVVVQYPDGTAYEADPTGVVAASA